jgi:hypothetical protein
MSETTKARLLFGLIFLCLCWRGRDGVRDDETGAVENTQSDMAGMQSEANK